MSSDTETTVGNCEISVLSVAHKRTNKEEGGSWITGEAKIAWTPDSGHTRCVTVYVGCWDDTDDDNAEWCAANEGARAIDGCFGLPADRPADTRGTFSRMAFPDQCESIGREICQMLREAAIA